MAPEGQYGVGANGITVISTDFEAMGKAVSKAIIERETIVVRNPTRVIERDSL